MPKQATDFEPTPGERLQQIAAIQQGKGAESPVFSEYMPFLAEINALFPPPQPNEAPGAGPDASVLRWGWMGRISRR